MLSAQFVKHLQEPLQARAARLPALESQLAALVVTAQRRWPSFVVPAERFVAYLAARVPGEAALDTWLAALGARGEDLYLACGCAGGDVRALAAFEENYFSEVDRAGAHLKSAAAPVELDDLKQLLRERLFVAAPDQVPKIAEYTAAGPLRNWLRVVVSRAIINLIQRAPSEVAVSEEVLLSLPFLSLDPEMAYLKDHYRAEAAAALREAIGRLTARQRTLLRYQLVDGLNREQIGAIYQVHGATAARWLQRARTDLHARLRRGLMARLRIQATELDSILRLISSQLDMFSLRLT